MGRKIAVHSSGTRNSVRLALALRCGFETDGFEIAVIELEQFRIRNGGASVLERIRKGRAVEGIEVREESDKFARERRRLERSRVCRNSRLGHRGNRSHRTVEWDDGRKKYEQDDYEHDVLYPPEYPRNRWHSTPPLKTQEYFRTRTIVSLGAEYVNTLRYSASKSRHSHNWAAEVGDDIAYAGSACTAHKRMRESEDGARCQYN
jgi:hypothetical protein